MLWACVCNLAVVVRHEKRLRRIYCHLWPIRLFFFFFAPHHLRKDTVFERKMLIIEFVFWFSLQLFFCKVTHSKKNSAKYYHKYTHALMLSTRYSCQILIIVGFFLRPFKKFSKYQMLRKSYSGSPVTCGQADRRCEVIVALLRTRLKM